MPVKHVRTRWVLLAGLVLFACGSFAQDRADGLGPFTMLTRQGEVTVKLLRMDDDLVWILREISAGDWLETAVETREIITVQMERPTVLKALDEEDVELDPVKVHVSLKELVEGHAPFKTLSGMYYYEAAFKKAMLYEKGEDWKRALALYERIYPDEEAREWADKARVHAGLCYAKMGDGIKALDLIDLDALNEDDIKLLSDGYYAVGNALFESGQYEEALMHYLYLVVFYPFVENNEIRCLSASLSCYEKMEDWPALAKGFTALRSHYPETPETAKAEAWMWKYEEQLANEANFSIKVLEGAATDE